MTAPVLPIAGLEEHTVAIAGRRVRYLRCGAGPHLVLVHGLLGYSFCWRKNYTALGEHFTVTALDLPGVGFSERDRDMDCSLRASAARFVEFLEKLDIRSCILLGNSYGGAIVMMATAMLRDRPGPRVNALILAGAAHPWLRGNPLLPLAQTRLAQIAIPACAPLIRTLHSLFVRRMYGDSRRMEAGVSAAYAAPMKQAGTVRHAVKTVRGWKTDMAQLEAEIPKLRDLPILLLWGDRDRAVPLRTVERLRAALPQAEYRVVETAGHLVFEEMPEEFNRAVIGFAERHAR